MTLLTEVFISALSHEAYETLPDDLENWLYNEHRILRQGDIFSLDGPNLHYRLDMLSPVLQGFAQKGTTRIVLTLGNSEGTLESADIEPDFVEIDEQFLASATLGLPSQNASNTFDCKPLIDAVSQEYDDCTIYLKTQDLSRVGGLNGDWAVAQLGGTNYRRLVRILADDSVIQHSNVVQMAPLLLHNICKSQTPSILLRSSPFGSGSPAIPTAKSVTVARVASPISVDKTHEPAFLKALRHHFNASKRIVKKGDLVAVGIDTTNRRDTDEFPETQRSDEVVYFIITNTEHDVVPVHDSYLDLAGGELGCYVDPTTTRLIQAGVEHCRVPSVGRYFRPHRRSPSALLADLNSTSCLLGPASPFSKLSTLCSATLLRDAVDYNLNVSILLKGVSGIGKYTTARWVAETLGIHFMEINCYDIVGESEVKTEGTLRARFEKLEECSPCILFLRHIDAFIQTTQNLEPGKDLPIVNVLQECIGNLQSSWRLAGQPALVFGSTHESDRLPIQLVASFKHDISFEAPNEDERREMLRILLSGTPLAPDVSLSRLATETAALVASDLTSLVQTAESRAVARAANVTNSTEKEVIEARVGVTAQDFESALEKIRTIHSESIGAPKIPNVTWDDVGGLASVKSDILDTIQLPLEHPELFSDGLKKRSGILLYGPPGTGKTLLAKAVATSCSLNFFSVKGPELLNMYIGESEANVRRVFQRARDARPCVIFFDELDSVAPKRGNHGDSGGVMDRIVSQLLAELDGMSSDGGPDVFVIGATNRPDLLDPALLRPGRFDRLLYLGVSDTHEAQLNILKALTRKFRLDPALDLQALAEQCPFNYTGADFYALCSDAMLNAMSRKADALEAKLAQLNVTPLEGHPHPLTAQYYLAELASSEDIDVLVSQADFDRALRNLEPSVSQSEMDHYKQVQQRFSGAV
ncbi:AAA domain-containing protein [Mycena indigotica]|uniref:Peroxisomal ATPase PEX6 n=1 Tax=Mycena indigotica TaxID=2126181 RepID=A0A8H6VVA4_9AGAR|nr:AAA domain-containing protein [Mycena indigotica]KAF7295187.1 AAA domain-containing protein [Mycena indigotica]